MARLIDADALLSCMEKRLNDLYTEYGHRDAYASGFDEGIIAVEDAPTVDAVEVVHGEWIFNRGQAYGESLYFCSVCTDGGSEWGTDKYCPNCGAKMDGERKDSK